MKKILIVTGDPNSINSEIIYKTWKRIDKNIKKRIYIISNYRLLKTQFKKLNYSVKMIDVKIEGISLLTTERGEIRNQYSKEGRSISKLINSLLNY